MINFAVNIDCSFNVLKKLLLNDKISIIKFSQFLVEILQIQIDTRYKLNFQHLLIECTL